MKRYIFIIIFVTVIAVIYHFFLKEEYRYEKNYWEKIGFSSNNDCTYDEIVRLYGQPNNVSILKKEILELSYEGISFRFNDFDEATLIPKFEVDMVYITNSNYHFGRKKISIGSAKKEVEKAYKKTTIQPKEKKNTQNTQNTLTYVDGHQHWLYVNFYFDENDEVTEISFHEGP